jgi:PST family polysaccharide transporter
VTPAPAEIGGREGRELARTTLRGTAWVGASQFGGKLLFFACTLLLARLLTQDDFGVAAYAITLVTMLDSLPALGLAPALIHHRDDPELLDTGFWLGLAAGVLLFALVWLLAPFTAWFFGDDRAVPVTRALALVFPLEALRNVHATLLRKRLAFRRRFVPDMVQSTSKGAVAIALALAGFDYWSLIWGTVAATALGIPVFWAASGWRPGLRVDAAALRRLLPFGAHVMSIDLLGAFVRNVDYLLVGRFLGAAALGTYTLAFRIPDLLVRNLCLTLGQVLLPLYSSVRRDPGAVEATFLASIGYVTAITAPIAIGLALVAEPLVVTALGERWRGVASVLPSIAIYALLISFTFNLGDLYKALGRPDVLTRLSLLRAAVAFPALWFGAAVVGSAAAVGWAQAAVAGLGVLANAWVAARLFRLPVGRAFARVVPVAGACACMSIAVLALRPWLAGHADALQLGICALVGALTYAIALRALAREFWDDGQRAVLQALSRRPIRTEVAT